MGLGNEKAKTDKVGKKEEAKGMGVSMHTTKKVHNFCHYFRCWFGAGSKCICC